VVICSKVKHLDTELHIATTTLKSLELSESKVKILILLYLLIWNLYQGQSAYVKIGDSLSSACSIGRGVRQGFSLSPLLYLLYV